MTPAVEAKLIRVRQVLDLTPDAFYAIGHDGRMLFANRSARVFIIGRDEPIEGQLITEIATNRDIAELIVSQVRGTIAKGEVTHFADFTLRRADGEERIYDYRNIPYVDEVTGTPAIIGTASDVTDQVCLREVTRDLEIAGEIQRGLLPSKAIEIEGFAIAGWSEAAADTGGDHYDWLPTSDGRVIVTLADVSGHGIGPAIVAAVCRAYARATLGGADPLATLIGRLNDLMCDDTPADRFVTMCAAVVHPARKLIELVSAGQGPIMHVNGATGAVREIETQGPPLAVVKGYAYDDAARIPMGAGDMVVLVSDGFFEWPNAAGEQFGIERVMRVVSDHRRESPSGVIERLREAVKRFAGSAEHPDDMTAVVVKRG